MYERDMSEFSIYIPKRNNMYKSYDVYCIYDPYHYKVKSKSGILVVPEAYKSDSDEIVNSIIGSNCGITSISVEASNNETELKLYLSYDSMENNGNKIKAINSTMKIGSNESIVYYFDVNKDLKSGEVNLVNSSFYNVKNQKIVFDIAPTKIFTANDDTLTDKFISGVVVEMNEDDYNDIFNTNSQTKQSVIYFENDSIAASAIQNLPDGYIGMLSNSLVYVQNVGNVYAMNLLWYGSIILLSILLAAILFIIFMRSINVFLADFSIYKTLGIPSNVSANSLYIQMFLIFIPTLVLLPIISLIACNIKALALPFISIGNYLFIEALLLVIVMFVAFGFNRNLARSKISDTLRRGSK